MGTLCNSPALLQKSVICVMLIISEADSREVFVMAQEDMLQLILHKLGALENGQKRLEEGSDGLPVMN